MRASISYLGFSLMIAWASGAQAVDVNTTNVLTKNAINFKPHRVGNFRSEVCGVADFNNDGLPDIVAGEYLYLAPKWQALKIRTLGGSVDEQGKGYRHDFANLPQDVDGDGLLDVISVDWFGKHVVWFKNVGSKGGEWPMSLIHQNGNFEAGDLGDLEGRGFKTAILPWAEHSFWCEAGPLDADNKLTWRIHLISPKQMHWGVGVGDLNGDGRPDYIRPNAWFEAPADLRKGVWLEHSLALGAPNGKATHTAQILVYDVNGDGLADIITSAAHTAGIFWYEQQRANGQTSFKQHLIDDTWTQAHSLALGDLDGDGLLELVAGKRFQAHNGSDPEADAPLGVYYYKFQRQDGASPIWRKHVVAFNTGIGSGVNLCLADINLDGKLDIVVTGKWGGPVWFENQGFDN